MPLYRIPRLDYCYAAECDKCGDQILEDRIHWGEISTFDLNWFSENVGGININGNYLSSDNRYTVLVYDSVNEYKSWSDLEKSSSLNKQVWTDEKNQGLKASRADNIKIFCSWCHEENCLSKIEPLLGYFED